MAIYSVTAGMIGVHDKTLVASTVDAVNFADDPHIVEIISDGTAAIYVTIDGSEPTVGGANTHVLPALPCSRTLMHTGDSRPLKLISSGSPTYSVMVV